MTPRATRSGAPRAAAFLFLAASSMALAFPGTPCGGPADGATEAAPKATLPEGPRVARAALVADFEAWLSGMAMIHPEPMARVDRAAYRRIVREIRASLTRTMSTREAWLLFARLAPTLNDGHSGVLPADFRARMRAHLAAGGGFFPLPVDIGRDGDLRVAPGADAEGIAVGERIASINGIPGRDLARAMLARVEGDTPRFRRALASRRFAFMFWMLHGDTGRYLVGLDGPGCRRRVALEGATRFPASLEDPPFRHAVFDGGIGYIEATSFGGEHADAFAAFAREAFASFREANIRALLIDVRVNVGGDDALWQAGLMEYITRRPYIHVSRYARRVTAGNVEPGEAIGEVRRRDHDRRITPAVDNPLRFEGPVYVLTGPLTYSAAIQFVVAAQDFAIATIVGEETAGLSCQTGRVTPIALPHTGLSAFTPAMAFTRPSGRGCRRGVVPDIAVAVDPLAPEATLQAALERIRERTGDGAVPR